MPLLDWLTVISYAALNVDLVFQIVRIYKTRSSADLSLFGMTIRYAAIVIILFKFISLGDIPIIVGQSLLALSFTIYLTLALIYFGQRRQSKDI